MDMLKFVILFNVFICLSLLTLSGCDNGKNPVQTLEEPSLIGIWDIEQINWDTPDEKGSYSKNELDSLDVIWNFEFMDNDSVAQTTNISGDLFTMYGTWTDTGTKLIITLSHPSGTMGTIEYVYCFNDALLCLDWQIPSAAKYHAEFTKVE